MACQRTAPQSAAPARAWGADTRRCSHTLGGDRVAPLLPLRARTCMLHLTTSSGVTARWVRPVRRGGGGAHDTRGSARAERVPQRVSHLAPRRALARRGKAEGARTACSRPDLAARSHAHASRQAAEGACGSPAQPGRLAGAAGPTRSRPADAQALYAAARAARAPQVLGFAYRTTGYHRWCMPGRTRPSASRSWTRARAWP